MLVPSSLFRSLLGVRLRLNICFILVAMLSFMLYFHLGRNLLSSKIFSTLDLFFSSLKARRIACISGVGLPDCDAFTISGRSSISFSFSEIKFLFWIEYS